MKRKLLSLTAALLCAVGASAYTTTDLTSAGWTSVTSLPTPLSDYYFVFVDNDGSLMLDYATGSNQLYKSYACKTMFYRTNANPTTTPTMIWTLTNNTAVSGTYSIKNVTEPTLYLQEEYDDNKEAPWYCHTSDNGGGEGVNKDWCAYNIVYADGKWTIQTYRVRNQSQSYVGPWSDSNFTDGAEVAGNKSGANIGYFQIYAIKRSKAKNLNFTASKISNPSFESDFTDWTNTGTMATQTNTAFTKTGSKYAEFWQPNGTKGVSQTISGLPAGQYCLSAHCKARGVTSAKIFAGSNETPITIEDKEADYHVYFTNDGSSSVSIGFQAVGTGANDSWIAVDNFQLKYYGTKVDESADMPSSGSMVANGWYSLIIPTAGSYNIKSTSAATIYYTQNGATSLDGGTALTFTAGEQKSLSLSAGNLFIKSSVSQVVDVDTRFYLITTVNDERKWLNKNASGITYAYDKGLPFKLESSNGNAVLKFSEGNYLNDVGSSWQTKAEGSHNNEWKVASVEGGYKLLLGVDNRCQLVVINATTGLVEMTRYTDDGNVWQFIQPETALNNAISDAETHTLGFEDGEYAPYNNVTAISALATAKAATTNDARVSAYKSLTDATWTANVGEVNAIYWPAYTAESAKDEGNRIYAMGWGKSGGTDAYNTRIVVGTADSNPGIYNYLDNHEALMTKFATTYGEETGYTMPLKASTIYKLSFKYGGMENTPTVTIRFTDPESNTITLAPNFTPVNASAHNSGAENQFEDYEGFFVTNTAGNYVLNLTKSNLTQQQIAMGNISLVTASELPFSDGSVPTYAPGTYPSVKITRSLTADRWATAVYPFAVSGVDNIAVLDSYNASTGDIGFATAAASTANMPFLMYSKTAKSEISLSNVAVSAANATDATAGKASLKGAYTTTNITNADKNYVLSNNAIYPVGSNGASINPYRAYIQIDQSSSVKALNFFIDGDEATGISLTPNPSPESEGAIYNVAGQRMSKMQKGINIVNGKKIAIK